MFSNPYVTSFFMVVLFFNMVLTLMVYIRNPKSATHKILGLLGMTISIWLFIFFLSLQSFSQTTSLLLIRLSIFMATPMSTLFFLFAYTLPNTKFHIRKNELLLLIGLTGLIMIMALTPYSFTSVDIIDGTPQPQAGPGLIPFGIYVLISTIGGVFILYKRLLRSDGIEREQLKVIAFGIIIMYGLLISTIFLPVAIFQNTTFVPFSPLYTLLFLVLTSYAILKHRFLDMRIVVVRAVVYTLLIVVVVVTYTSILYGISLFITGGETNIRSSLIPMLITITVVLSFQPLRQLFESITSKIFYKDKYDSQDVLWKLSRTMASTLELRELSHGILKELLSSIKISYGTLALIRSSSIIWVDSAGKTHDKAFKGKDVFTVIHESYKPKSQDEQIIIFEELSERKNDIKDIMREHEITIVLPLVVRKELIGGLILGEKHSGEIYSSDDIDLLKIVAHEVAIAVRNALSFEEIKRFNITLEEEVKDATTNLKSANKRLKELDLLKDEFVSIASHELRTPMTAIKSYLWMALNQSEQEIKQPLKKYLDISYNSTERLIRLVNDMLTVSRIERNKIELNNEKVNVADIVQLVFDELKISADEKHIAFTFSTVEKKKYFTKGDKEKLREVFQNLIGNALKFTPEKGSIALRLASRGKILALSVTDTGSGIPQEEQQKLFKKFSKIEYSYSKHSSQLGTGLGLYISKQIVSLHNGTIEVQSEVGKGSTFTVLLPELIS
ncbi:MAG: ATP-binding protein [bacterium]|nr:ATP-binding protein [bacterium]